MTPELKSRIKTALFGVTVLILLLTLGEGIGALIVASVLSVAMLYEFTSITISLPDAKEKRFVVLGCAWLLQVMNFWMAGAEFALVCLSFLGMTAYFLFTSEKYNGDELKQHYREMMSTIFGFVYLAFLPTYLVAIRLTAFGKHWILIFLFIVWANDVGAYFAGKRFGKRKLFPHISPKKTWEGALGGWLTSVVIALIYKAAFFRQLSWFGSISIATILSVVAPVGDLAESFLKRAFDKKDSSSILPGHGGFLDRFDAVVFSLPVMYALTRLF
ncbi:MAG: phosphatidate cytidylyltransferase [Bdellovibrionales bacterium]|nr:phosphatidate cytidylyltransferase [Bdellovibrionales bacterium]